MGQSTDAIVCYGVQLGEELPDSLKDDPDGFLDAMGAPPTAPWCEEEGPQKEAWRESLRVRREFAKSLGVRIERHCSGDYPMYTLVIAASVQRAARGYPEELRDTTALDDWTRRIMEACAVIGFKPDHEPTWWLQSYWG